MFGRNYQNILEKNKTDQSPQIYSHFYPQIRTLIFGRNYQNILENNKIDQSPQHTIYFSPTMSLFELHTSQGPPNTRYLSRH